MPDLDAAPLVVSGPFNVVEISDLRHVYPAALALDAVSLALAAGSDTAVIGPDGVGKSTLLNIVAGARIIQGGRVEVLGGDMRKSAHRSAIASKIAFMPQGLGKNIYPTLTVAENLAFFASLYASSPRERKARAEQLLKATGLEPFAHRPAGKLSGGMRQKLSLCCALVHDPEILILDEPTTGIDPLSRRQFWQLVDTIKKVHPALTLLVATADLGEAERFSRLVVLDAGRILAAGDKGTVLASVEAASIEEAFVRLRHPGGEPVKLPQENQLRTIQGGPPAIVAEGLTRRFGDFTAVDDVSFRIERGEIFGFLGSNGCGKTTTMKMLTGLIPATSGHAELFGHPVDAADIETRRRVGYMSQFFSLYGELTVRGNLDLHAKLYDLMRSERTKRIDDALLRFDLVSVASQYPESLPLGVRQRLQLAAACLHKPEILILDEPTSGVDPEARDRFWDTLRELSRRDGVTIFVSTHFMREAERCDRMSFMHAGKVLAVGTSDELRDAYHADTLDSAFIACLEQQDNATAPPGDASALYFRIRQLPMGPFASWVTWVMAFARREAREVLRDPVRLAFGLLAPLALMMTFARGISFDIEALPFSVFDQDRSAESQMLTIHLAGSRYFSERKPALSDDEVNHRLQSGLSALVVGIPLGFGKALLRGEQPTISLWLDGANPARANTARGYAEGVTQSFITSLMREELPGGMSTGVNVEPRFFYNQDFRSVFAMTPGVIMFILVMTLSMMTALGVVREREIGSIINLAVSPASTGSFLVGKFLPYVAIGMVTLSLMIALAVFGLDVPIKGSFAALVFGGFLYVLAATTFGILVSTFVRSQVAAIFACAILTLMPALNFSGLLQPVSNLSPTAQMIGLGFPSSWFQQISIGVFAKGLPFEAFFPAFAALSVFPIVYLLAARAIMTKQEP